MTEQNTTGTTNGTGTAYPYGWPMAMAQYLVFYVAICGPLFVLISFFFWLKTFGIVKIAIYIEWCSALASCQHYFSLVHTGYHKELRHEKFEDTKGVIRSRESKKDR